MSAVAVALAMPSLTLMVMIILIIIADGDWDGGDDDSFAGGGTRALDDNINSANEHPASEYMLLITHEWWHKDNNDSRAQQLGGNQRGLLGLASVESIIC